MATKVQLTGGAFQDSEGNVLASGYLMMKLSQDSKVNSSQVCSGVEIRIDLDGSGNVIASPAQSVWGNDQLLPINSFYRVTGYKANGQPAWGPNNQQVIGNGGTFDVGTWVPNSVISWTPPVQTLVLKTNSTLNGSQTLQDLKNGSNVTITDDGVGGVTIAAAGATSFSTGAYLVGPTFGLPQIAGGSQPVATVNDGVRVFRFYIPFSITISACSINVLGGAGGHKFSFGIYNIAGTSLLVNSGVFTTSGTGIQTRSFGAVTLTPGVYWFAQTADSSTLVSVQSFDQAATVLLPTLNANLTIVGTAANASAIGVLPATLGVITPDVSTAAFRAAMAMFT